MRSMVAVQALQVMPVRVNLVMKEPLPESRLENSLPYEIDGLKASLYWMSRPRWRVSQAVMILFITKAAMIQHAMANYV